MRVFLIALLAAISYAQTDMKKGSTRIAWTDSLEDFEKEVLDGAHGSRKYSAWKLECLIFGDKLEIKQNRDTILYEGDIFFVEHVLNLTIHKSCKGTSSVFSGRGELLRVVFERNRLTQHQFEVNLKMFSC